MVKLRTWAIYTSVATAALGIGCADEPRAGNEASAPARVQTTSLRANPQAIAAARRASIVASRTASAPVPHRSLDGAARAALPRPNPRTARGSDTSSFARALTPPSSLLDADHRGDPHSPLLPPAALVRAPFGQDVLAVPRLVPVFYPGDPMQAQIEDFVRKLASSQFWANAAEYGVGQATAAPSFVLPQQPPARISSAEIDAFIASSVGGPAFPAATPGDIYLLLFPPTTTVTLPGLGSGDESCISFGAYHSGIATDAGGAAAYAVIPRCNGYLGNFGIDAVTSAVSHEAIEAATDPFGAGYIEANWEGSGMSYAFEGSLASELTDFCEFLSNADERDPEIGYLVQRFYSNRQAIAGHDPCLPAPARPYFNAVPIVTGTTLGNFAWAKGAAIPPGGKVTIPVKLFADAPTGSWELSADQGSNPHLPPETLKQLSFSFDVPHGRAGDVRHLTITRALLPAGTQPQPLPFEIVSTQGSAKNIFWGVVGL